MINKNFNNILITVVRYFGGIKLGRGGLVRAYTQSASKVLQDIDITELIKETVLNLICNYENYQKIKRVLKKYKADLKEERFEIDVKLSFAVAKNKAEDLKCALVDVAKGAVRIEK